MAQKFDNGASFGTVREILNANADEINVNKAKAESAYAMANTLGDTATNVAGRVGGNVNALTAAITPMIAQSNKGGAVYINKGVLWPVTRVLSLGASITLFATNNQSYICDGVIWQLNGTYKDGWRGTTTYTAVALISYQKVIAVDLTDGKVWVFTPTKGWHTSSAGDTSGIEAEITALRAAVEAAQTTANEAKTAATTLANASTQGVVRTPDTTTPVTPGLLDYNIQFSAGYGATFAPSIPASGSLSDMIGQFKSGRRYGVYKFDGTYTGGWGATGKVTGKGSLLIMPNNTAIALCSDGDDASIGVFFFLAGVWVDLRAINPLASAGADTVAGSH